MTVSTNDQMLRNALRVRLGRRHIGDPDAFVVEELPVARGEVRADMAVINGRLEGIEIKSSRDTLQRLKHQAHLYGQAFERMTLVAAPGHLDEAIAMLPAWWGVFLAEAGPRSGIRLTRVRQGKLNGNLTAQGLVGLLERDEILGLLCSFGQDQGVRSAGWQTLADRVVENIPLDQLREGTRRQIKVRALIEARARETAFGTTAFGGGLATACAA